MSLKIVKLLTYINIRLPRLNENRGVLGIVLVRTTLLQVKVPTGMDSHFTTISSKSSELPNKNEGAHRQALCLLALESHTTRMSLPAFGTANRQTRSLRIFSRVSNSSSRVSAGTLLILPRGIVVPGNCQHRTPSLKSCNQPGWSSSSGICQKKIRLPLGHLKY
jgi:hypothetical protein